MKYIHLIILFSINLFVFGQKNNYNSFIAFDDEYLDKILYAHRDISTASEYHFYGKIKSVYIEKLDGNGKISGTPAKSFYDKNRNQFKRINYNSNLKDYVVLEFYFLPKYGGNTVFKSSYEVINGVVKHNLTSEIDTINHIIVNKKFVSEQLTEIDTFFYIKDYKPTEIRTVNLKTNDKTITKIAYLENGNIYKKVYKRNTHSFGSFVRYNNQGKRLFSYKIDFDDFNNISTEHEDDKKIKEQKFIWNDDNDFEFYEDLNSVVFFNFKEKTLRKEAQGSTVTTYFNDNLLPIKIISIDKRYDVNMQITFEYNKYNDLISKKIKNENLPLDVLSVQYKYDDRNNWIERKEYENGKLIFITKRQIEYY
jgi:hypothetical protein